MRISGSLERDFDEHAGLFPRPTGPDDRPAPPAGGAGHAHAVAADRSERGAAAGAQGPARAQHRRCRPVRPHAAGGRRRRERGRPPAPGDPLDGVAAVPEACLWPERRGGGRALGRERGVAVLQRAGVLRAAPAVRCHADRALQAGAGRGRRGGVAGQDDRGGRADAGGAQERTAAGDRGHHGAGKGGGPIPPTAGCWKWRGPRWCNWRSAPGCG